MKEKLLISACLLGRNCKYNGGNNYTPLAEELNTRYDLVPVCPECLGGLPIPHEPSERVGDKVLSKSGADMTEAFRQGAEKALAIAVEAGIRRAVLKERSPSCGSGQIYDGTFTKTLTQGDGLTTQMLKKHGITVYGESQIEELIGSRPFFFSI